MKFEYRKRHPYYGKYKIKIQFKYISLLDTSETQHNVSENISDTLSNLFKSDDYEFKGVNYGLYLKEIDHLDQFLNTPHSIRIDRIYRPAPGYENFEGLPPKNEKTLWYGRFPYKIVIRRPRKNNLTYDEEFWCEENCIDDYKRTCITGRVGFCFLNQLDASAFKLMFNDIVVETFMPNKVEVIKMLTKRIDDAKLDLKTYLEGEDEES